MGPNLEFLSFQFSVVLGLVGQVRLHAPRGIVKCLKSFRGCLVEWFENCCLEFFEIHVGEKMC